MFVRIIKARSKEYVVIVRGYRDKNGKARQKTVKNLGPVSASNREVMLEIGRKIIAQSKGHEIITTGIEIIEQERQNWGAPVVIEAMWKKFNFDEVLKSKVDAIKLMLSDRLLDPASKLATYGRRLQYVNYEHIKLQDLYRALDLLDKYKEQLQAHIFNKQKLYGQMDIVFFDVTTLFFESQKNDDLRNFGFSKDCKFNEVQIVLSMVINSEGRPLSYEIFPGNTFEGNTLVTNLKRLQKKYKIGKVIIVADRGIGSVSNLEAIKEAGFDYIVGMKLRTASKSTREEAINPEGYLPLFASDKTSDIRKYKIIQNKDSSWIVLWSSKRARKDMQDRVRLVARAQEMLSNNKLHDKRGAKKYIQSSKSQYILNTTKIEQDARFDGYYALSCSDNSIAPETIAQAYHGLWKIEESFRTIKSFFEVRPMFHWTPKRISGHIMLNFISLTMEVDLCLKLKSQIKDVSHYHIRDAIERMQRSILKIGTKIVASYSTLDLLQKSILKSINTKQPHNFIINLL